MGNRVSEKSIVDKIMRWLKSLPLCNARKRRGGISNAGQPDIEGCICGLHFEIEVKAPDGRLSKLQAAKLKQWGRAGAITGVAYSLDDARRIIYQGLAGCMSDKLWSMECALRDVFNEIFSTKEQEFLKNETV